MITLTALNGEEYVLNCDLIYKIIEAPDTIITLTDGKVLRVSNSKEDVVNRIIEYKRKIYINLPGGE